MAKAGEAGKPVASAQQNKVRLSSKNLKSGYANFCNANSTREEVVLNFGINHDWDRVPKEMEVELEHRIVLAPLAAKRLSQLLSNLIAEYEARYGELK